MGGVGRGSADVSEAVEEKRRDNQNVNFVINLSVSLSKSQF